MAICTMEIDTAAKEIAAHIQKVIASLPATVKTIYGRADSGFYCGEAVEAYEAGHCQFIVCARKTDRLVEELQKAEWKPSKQTDADEECEFTYQPQGWAKPYRFLALGTTKRRGRKRTTRRRIRTSRTPTKPSNINCSTPLL